MIDIVLTAVFSIVMLLFMAYPAKIISDKIAEKRTLSERAQATLTIVLTILFSLAVGLFLRFA
jgi:hypothetical protein